MIYRRFGPARDVLEFATLDDPQPGPGEVVVDLAYSGVNPSDVKARAGARPGVTKPPYPAIIPHSDGAGVVSAVGDGVDPDRLGQRVWIWNGQWRRPFGTAAEKVALPAMQAVAMADDLDLQTGATLGIPGLTAAHVVLSGGDVADRTILIHGGAGTVGYLAVQIAKWAGARVIATARGGGLDRARIAGADVVLDYSAPDLADRILAANDSGTVDRVVDVEFGQNAQTNAAVIAENGRINAYGSAKQMAPELPFYPLMFKAVTLEMVLVYLLTPKQRATAVDSLHRALSDGAVKSPVQQVFPLEDTALAHEAVEAGGRVGAILVKTGGA